MTTSQGGYVYVMSSPALTPGLCKIGLTRGADGDLRALERRREELSDPTGVPGPYRIDHFQYFGHCQAAERYIHEFLREFHYHQEFYWVPERRYLMEAFASALAQKGRFYRGSTRLKRLTIRRDSYLAVSDLHVHQLKRRHLDYADGLNLMRHSPKQGERLLLRAAGLLLPEHLTAGDLRIVRALRWLGIYHAAGQFDAPYQQPRRWPGNPTADAQAYMKSSKAVRYLTLAGKRGDFIAWGLLGQHHLARQDLPAASAAFARFVRELAGIFQTRRRFSVAHLESPVQSSSTGYAPDDAQLVMEILATAADAVLAGHLAPLPQEARSVLVPLWERSGYFTSSGEPFLPFRRALEGLRYGPALPASE